MARWLTRWVRFCWERPRSIVAGTLLLAGISAVYAALEARIDSDFSKLLRPSADLTWYRHDQAFKAAFPSFQQNAIIVLEGTDFEPLRAAARQLRDRLREDTRIAVVRAPGVHPFLDAHAWWYIPLDRIPEWMDGVQRNYGPLLRVGEFPTLTELAYTLADQARATPGLPLPEVLAGLLHGWRDSAESVQAYPALTPEPPHRELLLVQGQRRFDQALPHAALIAVLRQHLETLPAGVTGRLTGEAALATEEIAAALSGIELAGSISLLLLAAILWWGLRSLSLMAAIFTLLAVGVPLTLALAVLVVGSFNTLALIFIIMFFGLGVDFAVHFVVAAVAADDTGAPRLSPVAAAASTGPALALCLLTTTLGFLSFWPTPYRGLGELGVMSALGMLVAFVLTASFLPALLRLLPNRRRSLPTLPLDRPLPRAVAMGNLLLAVLLVPLALELRFDFSVLALRNPAAESMQALRDLQADGQVTDYSLHVLVPDVERAEQLAADLEDHPLVATAVTVSSLVPAEQDAKAALLEPLCGWRTELEIVPVDELPDAAIWAEARAYLEAARDAFADADRSAVDRFLGATAQLDDRDRLAASSVIGRQLERALTEIDTRLRAAPVRVATLPDELLEPFRGVDGRWLVRLQAAKPLTTPQAIDEFVTALEPLVPNYAGRAVIEAGVGALVVTSFQTAATLALATIGLVLLFVLRSLRDALLVLLPVIASLVVTLAAAQLAGLTLNMANILVVPLIVGLGVDTGVHIVHRHRQQGGLDSASGAGTRRAVLISGLTTLGTLASLSLSPHRGAASIGLLFLIAISALLWFAYWVLPGLLSTRARRT